MSDLINAIFLRRLNRFIVECERNNRRFKAYLPNPGRLWELLLPGRELYIKQSSGNLFWTVWAVKKDNSIICLHTHYINDIAERLIKEGLFPEYFIKQREVTINSNRIDFLLSSGKKDLLLEVKSCTLYHDGISMFPDAITIRGKRHLELLARMNGAILFIVPFPEAEYFLPDFHTDPEFSETLSRFRNKLIIRAVSVKLNMDMKPEFINELKIPWHIYDRESRDRGSYILYGKLTRDRFFKIGKLGKINFKKGYYLYIGSAMNSLSARLRRHMNKHKRMRWHIDYLVPGLDDLKTIAFRSSESLECLLADELKRISRPVGRFGSSDCGCEGHLYWFTDDPFRNERFINILLKYRISRLRRFL
ncbi:MAG: DNA/RNA nuclease SfsA [Thermodesulfovibrionales bacterium]|nr:DNA/RNA nuclease SfsA [Thermodesulfovibrionales bacterium]